MLPLLHRTVCVENQLICDNPSHGTVHIFLKKRVFYLPLFTKKEVIYFNNNNNNVKLSTCRKLPKLVQFFYILYF